MVYVVQRIDHTLSNPCLCTAIYRAVVMRDGQSLSMRINGGDFFFLYRATVPEQCLVLLAFEHVFGIKG